MEEKQKKTYLNAISGVIGVGVGLALVAIFLSVVSGTINGERVGMTLFDEDVDLLNLSIGFPLVSFIVTVIGGVMLAVAATMRIKKNKSYNPIIIAGVAITAIGAILVLVSGIMLKNDTTDASVELMVLIGGGNITEAMAEGMISLSLGFGVYLGFIGGLIAAIAGVVLLLKPFQPTAPAVAPAAADGQPAATAAQSHFCTKCGTSLAPDATFCTKCGTPVNQANNDQNTTL